MIISMMGIVLILIWARAFYGSIQSYKEGEAFLATGDRLRAIAHFDRSLHWYTPFNPYVEKSAKMLWEISQRAQKDGDMRLAIIAVRTLRSGFIAARSFYVPDNVWIERCDRRLRDLFVLQQNGADGILRAGILDGSILADPQVRGPDLFWSMLVVFGFLGWVGSATVFIASARGGFRFMRGAARFRVRWIVLFAVFWIVWIVGMVNA